jgi:hypothetical protein
MPALRLPRFELARLCTPHGDNHAQAREYGDGVAVPHTVCLVGMSRRRRPDPFARGTPLVEPKVEAIHAWPVFRLVRAAAHFARLGWLWLNQGGWNGRQILPRTLFEKYVKADVPLNTPKTETTLKPPFDDYLGVKSYGGGVDQGCGQGIYGLNWWHNQALTVPLRTAPLLAWPAASPDVFMALGRAGKDGMVISPSLGRVVAA